MCGPLAIGMLSGKNEHGIKALVSAVSYNAGRTVSYVIIGIGFGLLGSTVSFAGLQKGLCIGLGVFMVILFLFSVNPDQWISRQPWLRSFYGHVSKKLSALAGKSEKTSPVFLGIVNGFLPCGLVYLAIAGALSLGNIWGGMGFMMFFGLGTFPAMLGVTIGYKVFAPSWRASLRKLYPVIMLTMGVYLIYRGLMSKLPLELDFFEALKNPVMCH